MPSATFCSSNEASNLNGIDKFSNTVYEVVPLSVTTVSVKFALSVYILYFKFFCPLPYFFEPDELLNSKYVSCAILFALMLESIKLNETSYFSNAYPPFEPE